MMLADVPSPPQDPNFPAGSMQALRRALKYARVGTGEIAKAIESCSFDIRERGFTMLIVTCRRSGRWRKAMEIFETMRGKVISTRGVKPNFYTYSALISVCCNAGACAKAIEIIEEMTPTLGRDSSVEPDVGIYRAVISACLRFERFKSVLDLHHTMLKRGVPQDVVILLCVLEAFLKFKKWRQAADAMDELHAMGVTIPMKHYTHFMSCCAEDGNLYMALEIFLTMQMADVRPTSAICHQVMLAVRASDQPAIGLELLREMHREDIDVSLDTYNCLLWTLAASGQWEQTLKVFVKMEAHGVKMNSDTGKAVIKSCQNAGETDLSATLFCKFRRMGLQVHPPQWTIKAENIRARALSMDGHSESARTVLSVDSSQRSSMDSAASTDFASSVEETSSLDTDSSGPPSIDDLPPKIEMSKSCCRQHIMMDGMGDVAVTVSTLT
ncbi:hypothetical protein BSKO_09325 [Bryopsis sp. KO-2023]|nr:hypothetical protein BSKO_09325 [Bryopsis sp. KO-2023]